jgi:hypothetical protein
MLRLGALAVLAGSCRPETSSPGDDGTTTTNHVVPGDMPGVGGVSGSGGGDTGGDGGGSAGGAGGSAGWTTTPEGCSDLFDQSVVITYEIDIDPREWAEIDDEFVHWQTRQDAGLDINPYHPITLHLGDQAVAAWIRLKGGSSWFDAVAKDPHVKKQFVIAFDQGTDSKGRFHGVQKVKLDMPSLDRTFLHERLAWSFLRDVGLPALCANSGRLFVNGSYYGLYTNIEYANRDFLKRIFPGESDGALWKKRGDLENNSDDPSRDKSRETALWHVKTASDLTALGDLDASIRDWAAEALIPQPDGYWGGDNNFYVYDHPTRGFIWLADDLDGTFDFNPPDMHPLYFWLKRNQVRTPGPQYVAVISDPVWRQRFIDKLAELLDGWDTEALQARTRGWMAQIADALAADPNRSGTLDQDRRQQEKLVQFLSLRRAAVRTWLDCAQHGGTDADGDGSPWCLDCDDQSAAAHPGAREICGDGIDQNCNGLMDDGCP